MTGTLRAGGPVETPMSVGAFLLGADVAAALAACLGESGLLKDVVDARLGRGAARLLGEELGGLAAGFLEDDLGEIAVRGWALHDRLREAARETASSPGLRSVVDLGQHTVSGVWRPRLHLVEGDAPIRELAFELRVAFEVSGVAALVEDGLLVRLGGGSTRVSARFAAEGVPLAERADVFDARTAVRLGQGAPLLQAPDSQRVRAPWRRSGVEVGTRRAGAAARRGDFGPP